MTEVTLFFALLLIFFTYTSGMATMWMFLPHLIRGCLGLYITIVQRLPRSHDIIKHVEITDLSRATLESLEANFGLALQEYINANGSKLKRPLLAYTVLTLICYFWDCIAFLTEFRWYGVESHAKAETLLLVSATGYWFLSIVLLLWAGQVRMRVPPQYGRSVERLLMGFVGSLTKDAVHQYNTLKQRQ